MQVLFYYLRDFQEMFQRDVATKAVKTSKKVRYILCVNSSQLIY